jgi:hypothetical protein
MSDFRKEVDFLIRRGYDPALCLVGFLEMVGMGGYPINLTLSLSHLTEGISHDLWACYDVLALHPSASDADSYLSLGSNLGGIWSMIRTGLTTANATKALGIFKHIGTALTAQWWKRRRSGFEYSDAVGAILGMNSKSSAEGWTTIERLGTSGHLPAALWLAEGLETGEIGRVDHREAVEVLKPIVLGGPWAIDLEEMFAATNEFDRIAVLKVASALGNSEADYMLSYPDLFDN